MKLSLRLIFSVILICMLIVTTWASLHESVLVGGGKLFAEPWGIATLADAYFGFLTFYCWVFYKERTFQSRIAWFILVMTLGNIAMAAYVLWQIQKAKSNSMESILLRNTSSAK